MNPAGFQAGVFAAVTVFVALTALWMWSVRVSDASIIDIFWGPGFVLVSAIVLVSAALPLTAGRAMLAFMVTAWGLRLGLHLYLRNWGKGEDYRYRAMRKRDPSFATASLVKVFWLQGVLMMIVAMPLWVPGGSIPPGGRSALLLEGVTVWLLGFLFEAIGDLQLARFKAVASNQGQVMDRGLWRYTRHPNYFGDTLAWWGIYLVALANGAPWWSGLGPLVMTVLLMRVSGVTLLERRLVRTKPQYADYVRRTSAFVPWFPKP